MRSLHRPVRWRRSAIAAAGALLLGASLMTATAASAADDPRVDLPPGYLDAAVGDEQHRAAREPPRASPRSTRIPATSGSSTPTSRSRGDNAIVGNFNGFQVYDVSDPAGADAARVVRVPRRSGRRLGLRQPALHVGRGDARPHRLRHAGRAGAVNLERFRGVRIFDISDIDNPVQLPGVQTCRGSHTHTARRPTPTTPTTSTSTTRARRACARAARARGLRERRTDDRTRSPTGNPTQWRIDVIKVPLAAPQTAAS